MASVFTFVMRQEAFDDLEVLLEDS